MNVQKPDLAPGARFFSDGLVGALGTAVRVRRLEGRGEPCSRREDTGGVHQEWIEVQFHQLGHLLGDVRNHLEGTHERSAVDQRSAAIAAEQRGGTQRRDEGVSGTGVKGRDCKGTVTKQFGHDATETNHDDRSEDRIGCESDDRLQSGCHHRLEYHAIHLRPQATRHRLVRIAHRI